MITCNELEKLKQHIQAIANVGGSSNINELFDWGSILCVLSKSYIDQPNGDAQFIAMLFDTLYVVVKGLLDNEQLSKLNDDFITQLKQISNKLKNEPQGELIEENFFIMNGYYLEKKLKTIDLPPLKDIQKPLNNFPTVLEQVDYFSKKVSDLTKLEVRFIFHCIEQHLKIGVTDKNESVFLGLVRLLFNAGYREQALRLYREVSVASSKLYCLEEMVARFTGDPSGCPDIDPDWKRYRQQLYNNRAEFEKSLASGVPAKQATSSFNAKMKKFICSILEECKQLVGCESVTCCLVLHGSLSQNTMMPYSDFECGVLLKEPGDYDNYKKFFELFEFKIRSIGEFAGFRLDLPTTAGSLQSEGLHIFMTTSQLIALFRDDNKYHENEIEIGKFYSWLHADYLWGEKNLFDEYQKAIKVELIECDIEVPSSAAIWAKRMLSDRDKNYKFFNKAKVDDNFNIKDLYSLLIYFIFDLALYHGIIENSWQKNAEELEKRGILQQDEVDLIQNYIISLNHHRALNHFGNKNNSDKCNSNQIPDGFKILAAEIEKQILKPVYQNILLLRDEDYLSFRMHYWRDRFKSIDEDKIKPEEKKVKELFCQKYRTLPVDQRAFIYQELKSENELRDNKLLREIVKTLSYISNPDGGYPAYEEEKSQWPKDLSLLFNLEATENDIEEAKKLGKIVVSCKDLSGQEGTKQYLLKDSVQSQLCQANGQLREKPKGQPGNHTILFADEQGKNFAIKILPEQPGLEYAVNQLARRIGDHDGTLPTQMMKLQQGNSDGIVIQVMPKLEGKTLDKHLKENPTLYQSIAKKSFTATLLRVLLTNPEDDKGDDYFLLKDEWVKESYRLVRIDNERAFYKPEEEQLGWIYNSKVLQVKSLLYCLPQMHEPLDDAVLDSFLQLDARALLQEWLQDLEQERQCYAAIFTEKEIKAHFANKQPGTSLLGIPLAETLVEELFNRLDSIRLAISLIKTKGHPILGMDLLQVTQPLLANYYKRIFAEISEADAAQKRFDILTPGLYRNEKSVINGAKAVSMPFRVEPGKLTLLHILKSLQGEENAPKPALEWIKKVETKKLDEVETHLLSGNYRIFQALLVRHKIFLFEKIVEEHLKSNLSKPQLEHILKAIVGTPIHALSLSAFSTALTTELLLAILKGCGSHLLKLTLSGCSLLTDKIFNQLSALCPHLTVLELNSLPTLTKLQGQFGKLDLLTVSQCANLEKITIIAPGLKTLRAQGCSKIKMINTGSLLLNEIDVSACSILEENGLTNLSQYKGHLHSVELEGTNIRFKSLRMTYPYLVSLPFKTGDEAFGKKIKSLLDEGFKEAEIHPKSLNPQSAEGLALGLLNWLVAYEFVFEMQMCHLTMFTKGNYFLKIAFIESLERTSLLHSDKIIPILTSLLKDSDKGIRLAAVKSLGPAVLQNPNIVIPLLTPLLEDGDKDVSQAAEKSLGSAILEQPDIVTPLLEPLLKDDAWIVRLAAVRSLGSAILEQPDIVIPLLAPFLKDDAWIVRLAAVRSLGSAVLEQPDIVIPLLTPLLKDDGRHVREAAVRSLGPAVLHHPDKLALLLTSLLKDRDEEVRYLAVNSLGSAISHHPDKVIPLLTPLLKDGDGLVRPAVVQSLGSAVLQQLDIVIPLLTPLLKDSDKGIRRALVESLGPAVLQQPDIVIPLLTPLLKDDVEYVRHVAVKYLGSAVLQQPDIAIPLLTPLLKDDDRYVRHAAVRTLGPAVLQHPDIVIPLLTPLLNDDVEYVRHVAVGYLGSAVLQQPDIVILLLTPLLKDPASDVRRAAVESLGPAVLQQPDKIIPLIITMSLKNDNWDVRKAVVKSLESAVLQHPDKVIPLLTPLLKDDEWSVRTVVVESLGPAVLQQPDKMIPLLTPLLNDAAMSVRQFAVESLGSAVLQHPDRIIPLLMPLLKDVHWLIREVAVENLAPAVFRQPTMLIPIFKELLKNTNSPMYINAMEKMSDVLSIPMLSLLIKQWLTPSKKLNSNSNKNKNTFAPSSASFRGRLFHAPHDKFLSDAIKEQKPIEQHGKNEPSVAASSSSHSP